ncbi:hypothetical protein K8353_49130, partial [Burkholderia contaminans]|nr:hypothetical protein [Burkholderia contaminans]
MQDGIIAIWQGHNKVVNSHSLTSFHHSFITNPYLIIDEIVSNSSFKTYDLIVIGFGKAGKTLAGKLASAGKKVALVERSKAMY